MPVDIGIVVPLVPGLPLPLGLPPPGYRGVYPPPPFDPPPPPGLPLYPPPPRDPPGLVGMEGEGILMDREVLRESDPSDGLLNSEGERDGLRPGDGLGDVPLLTEVDGNNDGDDIAREREGDRDVLGDRERERDTEGDNAPADKDGLLISIRREGEGTVPVRAGDRKSYPILIAPLVRSRW